MQFASDNFGFSFSIIADEFKRENVRPHYFKFLIGSTSKGKSKMMNSTLVRHSTLLAGVVTAISLSILTDTANAATIVNGGFETGNFSGWTLVNQPGGSGNWFVTSGSVSPQSAHSIPLPTEGTKFAVTDQSGPGSHVLFQDISLEAGFQHILSFNWIAENWDGRGLFNPGTMNQNTRPNQQFRIDLVPVGFTNWFAPSSSAGILTNILAPVAQNAPVNQWNNLTFDLTPWAGSTVRLAFREVDNQWFFNAGVDQVKIASTPVSVPEPNSTLGLFVLGSLGIGAIAKRKLNKKNQDDNLN
ncbi:MAG TPA: hypothetical protein DEG17_16445 [Cyanobacteria bacterium UBA11149]|nr:hypothetical protein [Cyanobacteria bacterium UBA11366]HBW90414.1 hypothetical protein [Cyanobacteria bacterium UBA11149]